MAKLNDTGVYQLTNKNWAFRYTITTDGRKKDVRKAKDEFGNPLKTKTEAIRARNKAVEREREGKKPAPKVRKSFKEVYEEYCGNGRRDRAYRTKQKQDSLWNNHLCAKYGKRFVDEITAAEVNDYLSDLYYVEGFSYQYTEAFLKMFYLIFGQAYSRNYLEVDTYNKAVADVCPIFVPRLEVFGTVCHSLRLLKGEVVNEVFGIAFNQIVALEFIGIVGNRLSGYRSSLRSHSCLFYFIGHCHKLFIVEEVIVEVPHLFEIRSAVKIQFGDTEDFERVGDLLDVKGHRIASSRFFIDNSIPFQLPFQRLGVPCSKQGGEFRFGVFPQLQHNSSPSV